MCQRRRRTGRGECQNTGGGVERPDDIARRSISCKAELIDPGYVVGRDRHGGRSQGQAIRITDGHCGIDGCCRLSCGRNQRAGTRECWQTIPDRSGGIDGVHGIVEASVSVVNHSPGRDC